MLELTNALRGHLQFRPSKPGNYAKDDEHIQYNFGLVLLLLTPDVDQRVGLFREQVIIADDAQVSMFGFRRQAQTIAIT